jgi:hypothetical protein
MLYIQKDFQPSEYTVRQFRRWKTKIVKSIPARRYSLAYLGIQAACSSVLRYLCTVS